MLRWVTELAKLRKELKGETKPRASAQTQQKLDVNKALIDVFPFLSHLTRTQAAEVRGGPAASDPPAQQHAAQKLRLSAGEETAAGESAQASSGDDPGDDPEEAAGEEGGGEPARGHQGTTTSALARTGE